MANLQKSASTKGVKLTSSDGVDIGSVQQRDKNDNIYTPLSETVFLASVNNSDELIIDISSDSVGLFKSSDFTETRTIDADNVGLMKDSTFTETRTISQNNAGLFEASDFTETRNVRELQNETSVTSGSDTGGGTLSSNPVPDGSTVLIRANADNSSTIQIDGNFEMSPKDMISLKVDNTDKISYNAGSGDGLTWILEG